MRSTRRSPIANFFYYTYLTYFLFFVLRNYYTHIGRKSSLGPPVAVNSEALLGFLVGTNGKRASKVIWSSDYHISPIRDFKGVLQNIQSDPFEVVDKSLSGHCTLTGTCAEGNLKILNKSTGMALGDCPNKFKEQFWEVYSTDSDFKRVDAFICNHAISLCELFMSFGKPMILVASTRYEIGRLSQNAWNRWNKNLIAITAKNGNILVANNRYDAEYIKHFTGLNVPVLPSLCLYVDSTYKPSKQEILIGPGRLSPGAAKLIAELQRTVKSSQKAKGLEFVKIRDLYKKYEYADLAQHRAILLIPYQVSIMSIFEYYTMGIPLFAPSLELLVRWQLDHLVMRELSWNCATGRCKEHSAIAHDTASSHTCDPNDILNEECLRQWLKYADFYQWPGIVLFDSWDDLFAKIAESDLDSIHKVMVLYKEEQINRTLSMWRHILQSISSATNSTEFFPHRTWKDAMLHEYPDLDERTYLENC